MNKTLPFLLIGLSGAARADSLPVPPPERPSLRVRAAQTIISGEEFHRWERYVRGFRREHNFALSSGVSSGRWDVRRLGTLQGEYDSTGVFTRFQYSFHLPLYRGFGYFLGSGVGYHYESADQRQEFKPVGAAQFPGVAAGLVVNFNPVFRWQVGFEAYLERHSGIEERDGEGNDAEIHITMRAYDFSTAVDVFYDLAWALRIEAHRRHLEYNRPVTPDSATESFPVDANIRKDDEWAGIGLVYHLL